MVGEVRGVCSLLSRDENDQVAKLLGHLCQSLATTVIQLFQTSPPDHTVWRKHAVGVLCFVKDSSRRSYFFRLYCLVRNKILWEHEVYSNMEYIAAKPFFHLFEAEGCIVGFNFAVEEEARGFHAVLLGKMENRRRRRERQLRQHHQQPGHAHTLPSRMGASNFSHTNIHNTLHNGSKHSLGPETQTTRRPPKQKEKRSKTGRNITKSDIGLPLNFRHLEHIGWDANKGFAGNVEDQNILAFLREAGVQPEALKDDKTMQFIYDFIEENGGFDRVKNEVQDMSQSQNDSVPPPVPVRTVLPSSTRAAPPPPPSREGPPPPPYTQTANRSPVHPPPPYTQTANRSPVHPPPPRITNRSAPFEPPRSYGSSNAQSYAPKSSAMPPPPPPPPSLTPPPPPPMSNIPPPPPPGPPPSFSESVEPGPPPPPAVPDVRSALMEAIRSGATLKRVHQNEGGNAAAPADSRAMLLDQIRQGKELRAVQPTTRPPPEMAQEGSLASALARALAERSRAIHSDSSGGESGVDGGDDDDDDDDVDDDDDWDD